MAKRARCTCAAYPFPHRPKGGNCRHPDPPAAAYQGKAGTHAPTGMRPRSAIRERLIGVYGFHPIRDRERIRRFLPKLYVAHCRRHGLPYPEWWLGGYVPAMRVTAEGPRNLSVPPAEQAEKDPRSREDIRWEVMWRERRRRTRRNVRRADRVAAA